MQISDMGLGWHDTVSIPTKPAENRRLHRHLAANNVEYTFRDIQVRRFRDALKCHRNTFTLSNTSRASVLHSLGDREKGYIH